MANLTQKIQTYEAVQAELLHLFRSGEVERFECSDEMYLDETGMLPGRCHENVKRYCSQRVNVSPVSGWVKNYGSNFAKHSVVSEPGKTLLDVTLRGQLGKLHIVRHERIAYLCNVSFDEMPNIVPHFPFALDV